MNYQSSHFREGITKVCPTCGHVALPDPITVDLSTGIVSCDNWTLNVTVKQSLLLEALAKAYPRGLSHEAVLDSLQGHYADSIDSPRKLIATYVCILRRRLADRGAPFTIKTNWGVGYSLEML